METFSALLALCAGNSPVIGEFPHKSQWRGALIFYLICAWINGWVNNRRAGDLRRHRTHHDVSVMANDDFSSITFWVTSLTTLKNIVKSVVWNWNEHECKHINTKHNKPVCIFYGKYSMINSDRFNIRLHFFHNSNLQNMNFFQQPFDHSRC